MAKAKQNEQDKGLLKGLSLDKMIGDIKQELKDQVSMGATELGKALMHGHDPYVLYQRDGKDDGKDNGPQHGLPANAKQNEHENEMER